MTRGSAAIVSGVAGAMTLTAIHQLARKHVANAPRMDVLGKRAIARLTDHRTAALPPETQERLSLAGDVICNSAYYALVGLGGGPGWHRGAALGLAAGAGALVLPPRLGLGDAPHSESTANQIMTMAWYLLGGVAAACTWQALRPQER